MIFYGLADYSAHEIVEFFPFREAAEQALRQVLADERQWVGIVGVEAVEFEALLNY